MVVVYESSPGYYYIVKDEEKKGGKKEKKGGKKEKKGGKKEKKGGKKVKRISKDEYDKYDYNRDSIKVGDKVTIIIKPYKDGKYVTGVIKKILTNKKVHTRGHKVMLEDGTVGRMIKKEK